MRWHILRTLLGKEIQRQLANRGALALAGLMVAAAFLMSMFGKEEGGASSLTGGVDCCFVDYWQDDPWIDYLRQSVPVNMRGQVKFRPVGSIATSGGSIVYPPGTGAIQVRSNGEDGGERRYKICLWHPDADSSALLRFEVWFWKATARYFRLQAMQGRNRNPSPIDGLPPGSTSPPQSPSPGGDAPVLIEEERAQLTNGVDARSSVTTALILFAMFFGCIYLLPSMTCEERERGLLLAQALSPASPLEILAAKALFYPVAGMSLAAALAALAAPAVLLQPFFWLALAVAAFGSLGIGMTIACLARTQRAASLAALCYMLAVALLLCICQQSNVPGLPYLALEYHCPRMLHAALAGAVVWYHWWHLLGAAVLALGWVVLATVLFRRRGWQ
jgi:hypothetical protein